MVLLATGMEMGEKGQRRNRAQVHLARNSGQCIGWAAMPTSPGLESPASLIVVFFILRLMLSNVWPSVGVLSSILAWNRERR